MKNYVYLIRLGDSNICKIGYTNKSKTPQGRIKELQTGCPFELHIISSFFSAYSREIEKILHRQYAFKKIDENYNTLKGEWFELSNEDIKNFQKECQKIQDSIEYISKTSTFDDPLKYI